jgi:hypothetical protein
VDYPKNVVAVLPKVWLGGGGQIVVVNNLPEPGSLDFSSEAHAELRKWAERYRDSKYPGFDIAYAKP